MTRTDWPKSFDSERALDEFMTRPTDALVRLMPSLKDGILILGVGGKMGPTLAVTAKRAAVAAGLDIPVIGVSRFSDTTVRDSLNAQGIETIACDLLDRAAVASLPNIPNIVYMAGRKFGAVGSEAATWAHNAVIPQIVAERFRNASVVVFSTGCVYPLTPSPSAGCKEDHPLTPLGEYANSAIARERIFEYYSQPHKLKILNYRLFYAIDVRYGVLTEIGRNVFESRPVDLSMGYVNVIWQGDAVDRALRSFEHCGIPPVSLNVTGVSAIGVREIAESFGRRFNKTPVFSGNESPTALLGDASKCATLFGAPPTPLDAMIDWTANWLTKGGAVWNKPTHFGVSDGQYLD
jgi:nucleoside-diphosphate-sugar epimerase